MNKDTRAQLAINVRRLRIARHLSLSQLARETSMSKATLSGIELGRANPTIDTLTLLAAALAVPIAELLSAPSAGAVQIVRVAETGPWPPTSTRQRALETVAEAKRGLELTELALPHSQLHTVKPAAPGTRKAILVLQGKLIAGPVERISELVSGDYASFPADVEHSYETRRLPARALILMYTPA